MKFKNTTKKKSKKHTATYISLFIALIMILSILGFMNSNNSNIENSFDYNGYKLNRVQGKWVVDINKVSYSFDYFPDELETIDLGDAKEKIINSQMLLFTFDPDTDEKAYLDLFRYEVGTDLNAVNKYFVSGVLKKSDLYAFPIITCSNATQTVPVIVFNQSESTSFSVIGNCIYMNAEGTSIIKIKDKIRYLILGVIP